MQNSSNLYQNNPKLNKLREIVQAHFQRADVDPSTRVLVFAQLRSTVQEIVDGLQDCPGNYNIYIYTCLSLIFFESYGYYEIKLFIMMMSTIMLNRYNITV